MPAPTPLRRIPDQLLQRMARELDPEQRDEMAIPSYLHRNPAMRWMAWRRVEVLAGRLRRAADEWPGGRPGTIVDFGCGAGVLFEEASRIADRVIGVDLVLDAARMTVEALGLEKVTLLAPEAAFEEIPGGSVDILLAGEVLEHLEDDLESTLQRFRRWLAPGGRLLVSLPTESRLYRLGRRLAGFHGHYHHHNAASIHRAIVAAGYRELAVDKVPLGGPLSIYWIIDYAAPA
jgi:2-polyprenyl-3-methyl-5-hydroxy-6-metoxy-1,4-benzoquinol methylase